MCPTTSRRTGRGRDQLELIGIEGVLALRTSGEPDLFIHRGPWGGPVQFESALTGAAAQHAEPPRPAGLAPELATGRLGSFVAMLAELQAAIAEDRPHRSDVRDGRWALDMIMGVYESHRQNGARVALPLPQRAHPLERWLQDEGRRCRITPPLPVAAASGIASLWPPAAAGRRGLRLSPQ